MSVDKNKAVIEYLLTCPSIANSPLYFNFIEAKDGANQFLTMTNETAITRRYVDGSIRKRYLFNIVTFKSISENAVVKTPGYPNENIEDISDVQALMDWINEQDKIHNYPDFGEDCEIEYIETTTDTPRLMGINPQVTPPLAMYSMSIGIDYIDNSTIVWN